MSELRWWADEEQDYPEADALPVLTRLAAVLFVIVVLGAVGLGLWASNTSAQERLTIRCHEGWCVVPIEVAQQAAFAESIAADCGWSGFRKPKSGGAIA